MAQYGATSTEYFLPDALGSVRQLADVEGQVSLAQSFKPYGEVLSSSGEGATSYGFAGEWTDASGLVNLRARFYAPWQGRFLSRDTWEGDYERPYSLHKWSYSYSNPLIYKDASGLDPLLRFDREARTITRRNGTEIRANTWNDAERNAALMAAYRVGRALANVINRSRDLLLQLSIGYHQDPCNFLPLILVSPTDAFLKVYNGPVTFRHILDRPSTAYAETQGRNLVHVFRNYPENYAVEHPEWVVHELGHAFEHATIPPDQIVDYAPGRSGLPEDFIRRRPNDDNPRDPDRYAGFAGRFEEWQFSDINSPGEIFADMFLGWVYDTWAKDAGLLTPMAQRRSDYMDQNMAGLIGLALQHR